MPQKRQSQSQSQVGRHDGSWTVNIEKWWRRAAGYSRLNGSSSPPLPRRNSDIQMKKLDNERSTQQKAKPAAKPRRPSTARPVVIVERSREIRTPKWNHKDPSANINEEFIEVFYWTQSRYNYPGQLERYKKNLCYCCADCPACASDSSRVVSDRHRPLSQGGNPVRGPGYAYRDERPSHYNNNYYNGNVLRTSYT